MREKWVIFMDWCLDGKRGSPRDRFYDFACWLKKIKWKFYHRFHPRHRYNIVKTGLPPGYYDPDVRIEYAIVNEFLRWYEYRGVDRYHEESDPVNRNPLIKETYDALKLKEIDEHTYAELTGHLIAIISFRSSLWY